MEWMLLPLKRYADFSGRSRRKEYWMFVLFQLIVFAALLLVGVLLGGAFSAVGSGSDAAGVFGGVTIVLFLIALLALLIPSLAVMVRRFHDQDKSGWFVLLQFIPYVGGIVLIVFMCLEGTRGPNRFGDDPKGPATGDIFA